MKISEWNYHSDDCTWRTTQLIIDHSCLTQKYHCKFSWLKFIIGQLPRCSFLMQLSHIMGAMDVQGVWWTVRGFLDVILIVLETYEHQHKILIIIKLSGQPVSKWPSLRDESNLTSDFFYPISITKHPQPFKSPTVSSPLQN